MTILAQMTSTIDNTDSYKVSHWAQYPEGTEYVSSYIEPRSSSYAKLYGEQYNFAEFFGLQAFLKDYLSVPVTQDDIDCAEVLYRMHGEPFNKAGWQYILDTYQGALPIEVSAIPEGTVLPTSNAVVQIINTDPKCFWLTSYVETALLRAVWYPSTVATKSRIIKEMLRETLDATCDDPDGAIDFMLHDFGARGNNSTEGSQLGGMAHIVNFKGTDTVQGIKAALRYYEPEYEEFLAITPDRPQYAMMQLLLKMEAEGRPLPAYSVEASEHSTMTILGKEGEKEQIKRMIDRAKQGGIVSIVSDSYDYFNAVTHFFGEEFKQDMLDVGKAGGRVVIRPDSGDPVEVVTKTLAILEEKFGVTVNKKGYKVLPSFVRVLQGDGIDLGSFKAMRDAIQAQGYSVENLVFGMGGGLEQKVNRDDINWAQKASAACINGVWHDVYKDPHSDGMTFVKKSKRGILATAWDGVAFQTIRASELAAGMKNALVPVFRNGKLLNQEVFDEVRARAEYFTNRLMTKTKEVVLDPWAKVRNSLRKAA